MEGKKWFEAVFRPGCRHEIQGSARGWPPGLVNFIPAVAYHFCLALPAEFTQPGDQSPLVGDSFSTREEEV